MGFIRFSNMNITDSASLTLLQTFSTEVRTRKQLAKSHVVCSVLYSSKPDKKKLITGAVENFIINNSKSIRLLGFLFLVCHEKSTNLELGKVYSDFSNQVHPSFPLCMSVRLLVSQNQYALEDSEEKSKKRIFREFKICSSSILCFCASCWPFQPERFQVEPSYGKFQAQVEYDVTLQGRCW